MHAGILIYRVRARLFMRSMLMRTGVMRMMIRRVLMMVVFGVFIHVPSPFPVCFPQTDTRGP